MVIPKNGYIYIYVANESPTNVYYDNLTILHKKSNVSELNDYYPFGLLNQSQSQTSLSFDPMNNYQYQSKELQSQLGLNTLDFGLRHYDATLGRWGVQDPMLQYFNPYVAMGNNPVNQIDPNGGWNYAPTTPGDGNNNEETPLAGGSGGGSFYSMYMQNANMDGWFSGYLSSGGEDINWSHGFTDASGQFISNTQFIAIQGLTQIYHFMQTFFATKNISMGFNSQHFAYSALNSDFEFNYTSNDKRSESAPNHNQNSAIASTASDQLWVDGGLQDLTVQFDKRINETRQFFSELGDKIDNLAVPEYGKSIFKATAFAQLVGTGKAFDLKHEGRDYHFSVIGVTSIYQGKERNYQFYGNYNYGVAAKAYGYSLWFSRLGAGGAQLGSPYTTVRSSLKYFRTFFDEPWDYKAIGEGWNRF